MRYFALALSLAVLSPLCGQNLIRNGSFESPSQVGTTLMLQGQEPMQYHWGDGKTMFISWQPTGAESWWSVGVHPGTEQLGWSKAAHSGKRALWLRATDKPLGVVTGAGQILPPGPVTFSVWVRTEGAQGRVRFDCLPDSRDMTAGYLQESAAVRSEVALPADTGGKWMRLSGTIQVPEGKPQTLAVRLHLEQGTLWADDVQVEAGEKASAFNVRPAEQITIRFDHPRALPVLLAGKDKALTAVVTNTGTQPLSGPLTVAVARWDKQDGRRVLRRSLTNWPVGASLKVSLPLADRRPDAYLAFVRLERGTLDFIDGLDHFDGTVDAGGRISKAMVQAPCVARFALTSARPHRDLFGSGDMMLNTGGSWWGGFPIADYIQGREIGFCASRERTDDDSTFRLAAGGMKSLGDGPRPWSAPEDLPEALRNPVKHDQADLSNPAVWPYLERMWRKLGADLKDNPVYPLLHITGEEMVLYQGGLCPTEAADADFRGWVKAKYGTLDMVSAAWGRPVKSWEEIEQIISARMVREQIVKVDKEQEKRLDWLGAADKLNAEQGELLKADPGRGMDWLRWRNDLYLQTVKREVALFHETNPTTLLCNHFCWPNFVPQTTYGLAWTLDALGIDTQYPCGIPGSLGTPAETIDMMGMYEAFADRKPVWGMEIYIQPKFPAPMPATQVWGFIAHGMDVVNNFAWKPYSDAGLNAKRWNEPGAPPWWFVIDFDGTHMPQYDPLVRATREVNAFDARYGGNTLKRAKPDAAYFVSSDAGVLSHFETRGQWWGSPVVHARCELGWLLRLAGVSLDYLDDGLLAERLKDYQTVFVPYSPNVNDASLQLLADFAQAGGTVVFAGPSGRQDPWLKARSNVGGKAFAALQWKLGAYDPKAKAAVTGVGPLSTTAPLTAMSGVGESVFGAGTALLSDAAGKPLGWSKAFGKGRVIALSAFPSAYSQSPHAEAGNLELVRKLATAAGVTPRASWHTAIAPTPEKLAGEGAPVVDVMVRQKSERELFLFVVNIGGDGAGEVRLNLGSGWKLTDALTQKPVTLAAAGRLPLALKAWEYRVIRLTR